MPFFIATALDVPLTRSIVAVGVANDDASVTAFTPATAVFVADHADVLDVAVRGYGWIGTERCSSGGGCEERTCAHRESDCYLVHDVLLTDVSESQEAHRCLVPSPRRSNGTQSLDEHRYA